MMQLKDDKASLSHQNVIGDELVLSALKHMRIGGCMSFILNKKKSFELKIFLFLTIFLAPLFTVLLVSILGFSIWFCQIFIGPPGAG